MHEQPQETRFGRCVITKPTALIEFKLQSVQRKLRVYSGAGCAGWRSIRKSTSWGAVVLGQLNLETWSETQSLLAPSSRASGFYAAFKTSAGGLGPMSLLEDFDYEVTGEVLGDASAATGIIRRLCLGRTRQRIPAGWGYIKLLPKRR